MGGDQRLGLVPAQGGQGARDDDGHAVQRMRLHRAFIDRGNARVQQPPDHLVVLREAEIFHDAGGDDVPHVGNGRQLFQRRGLQRVQQTEAVGQISGGLAAHVGNAQREQERIQRAAAALFNGGDQVLRPLLLKAVQRQQIVGGQAVQVGAVPQAQPVVEQLRRLVREGINVHGVAAKWLRRATAWGLQVLRFMQNRWAPRRSSG